MLHLVVFDESNPHAVAFQLRELALSVERTAAELGREVSTDVLGPLARALRAVPLDGLRAGGGERARGSRARRSRSCSGAPSAPPSASPTSCSAGSSAMPARRRRSVRDGASAERGVEGRQDRQGGQGMTTRSYVVVHETNYDYEHPVGLSRQIVHLAPRTTPFQTCRAHALRVSPERGDPRGPRWMRSATRSRRSASRPITTRSRCARSRGST